MEWIFFLLLPILLYVLLLRFLPKGNPVSEGLRLPVFWASTFSITTSHLRVEKHRFGAHRRQYLLYFPAGPGVPEKRNTIVYFHGGGWRYGSPEMFKANAKVFIDEGYAVFMPSYRRTPGFGYKHIREDISLGLQKAAQILKEKELLGKKIILGGMSAGGNVAALALYDRNELAKTGLTRESFNGLFLLGAPLDLERMRDTLLLKSFAGEREGRRFRLANPIEHLREDEHIPVIVIHGDKDGMVEYASALSFVEKLMRIDPSLVEFHTMRNGSHLDVASWVYRREGPRQVLLQWLVKRESD